MPTQAPFPVNPALTAIAIAYANQAMIADLVLPRVPAHDAFKYTVRNKDELFTIPDTKLGRKSEANDVEFGGTEVTDSTQDYGLRDTVPLSDIRMAEQTHMDPLGSATENLTRLMTLDREKRVAGVVFDAAKYATANKATLSGTSQWSDYTNSNPLDAILAAMDTMIMRPNALVLGQAVWTKLRQHPKIVEAIVASGAGGANAVGAVARQALADLLELQAIYVGQGFLNTAVKGATVAYSRVWGKHAALIYQEPVTGTDTAATFGFTAESGGGVRVRDWFEPNVGSDGAQVIQVVDTLKEVIPANDFGYLFTNAVA